MFDTDTIIVREVCNGAIFITGLAVLAIFANHIRNVYKESGDWYRSVDVHAAAAIILLVLGHVIRAGASWMEFLWSHMGWDNDFWANTIEIFLLATLLIVLGKELIVFEFTPKKWRWPFTIGTASLAVLIPLIMALIVEYLN